MPSSFFFLNMLIMYSIYSIFCVYICTNRFFLLISHFTSLKHGMTRPAASTTINNPTVKKFQPAEIYKNLQRARQWSNGGDGWGKEHHFLTRGHHVIWGNNYGNIGVIKRSRRAPNINTQWLTILNSPLKNSYFASRVVLRQLRLIFLSPASARYSLSL